MRFQKTQVITFANQKGGCGKTSASVATAAAFAHLGYSATLVDTDPQCNATETLGVTQDWLRKNGHRTLADVYLARKLAADVELDFGDRFVSRLFLVPGHSGLNTVPQRLNAETQVRLAADEHSLLDEDDIKKEHRLRLRDGIESLRGLHDVVVIDTPPDLEFLMTTALIASDWFIIPVFPSAYDLKGMEKLAQTVKKIKQRYNPALRW